MSILSTGSLPATPNVLTSKLCLSFKNKSLTRTKFVYVLSIIIQYMTKYVNDLYNLTLLLDNTFRYNVKASV